MADSLQIFLTFAVGLILLIDRWLELRGYGDLQLTDKLELKTDQ